MSTRGDVLYHPINGTPEQTWDGFSWPGLLFSGIWLAIKGLWGYFVICILVAVVSAGFAAPLIWLACGIWGNAAHKKKLINKGFLDYEQWKRKERAEEAAVRIGAAPAPIPVPVPRDTAAQLASLVELRDKGILTDAEFQREKSKVLAV